MAGKEATVYIVDVGATMQEHGVGRSETNLDWALQYFWDRLTETVSIGRKTLLASVIALRSNETNNAMHEDEHYQNISVLKDLSQITMPDIRAFKEKLTATNRNNGDVLSALAIAIQLISTTCRQLSYTRRIVILTDARANMMSDDLSAMGNKIQEDNIDLLILGIDFDDASIGYKEENKDPIKAENEKILRQFCLDYGCRFGSLVQAIEELEIPRVKLAKPVSSYKGFLSLGDSDEYGNGFDINVVRYVKIMIAKPPSASMHIERSELGNSTEPVNGNSSLVATKNTRTYTVDDTNAPGGKKEVKVEDLAKGYEYGRTAVHISESDRDVTQFESTQSLSIIGFVDAERYDRFLEMDRVSMIVGEATNEKATLALSSFIHALHEMKQYAVARLVLKDGKTPNIVLLTPNIEANFECLHEVDLPFAEDIRVYKFPPLDRIMTVSGKEITSHRNLPSDKLQQAMNEYVDSMDLSEAAADDDGNPTEYMTLDASYNPSVHHVNRAIQLRAIDPGCTTPDPYHILTQYMHPPEALVEQADSEIKDLISASNVKKVPAKALAKRFGRKEERPLSGLDIGDLLKERKQSKQIDEKNAKAEFIQLFDDPEATPTAQDIEVIVKQLGHVLEDWIRNSVGNSAYNRVIELLATMREYLLDFEMSKPYNALLRELKQKMSNDLLGGDRQDMWFLLRSNKISLITSAEEKHSDATVEEGREFSRPNLKT